MKNLYVIKQLYVDDKDISKVVEYVYSKNKDTIFDYFINNNYNIIESDLEIVKENNWEIGLEHDNYDWYFQECIYWFETIKENISKEEAEKYVLDQFLTDV